MREGKHDVISLAQEVERRLSTVGIASEERPFSAHVTVGRVRSQRHRERLTERLRAVLWQSPPAWRVTSMRFYQSTLSPCGPTYTILAEVPLRA
jgi:2'-5' RNA ligase